MRQFPPFIDVETALAEMRAGRIVVLVDDEDRENEGDLTLAAGKITPEAIQFHGDLRQRSDRLALPGERTDYLRLDPMSACNTSQFGHRFHSIHRRHCPRRDYRHLGLRSRSDDSSRNRSGHAPGRPRPPRPRISTSSPPRWRTGVRRPDGGFGRPGPARRSHTGRGNLRN